MTFKAKSATLNHSPSQHNRNRADNDIKDEIPLHATTRNPDPLPRLRGKKWLWLVIRCPGTRPGIRPWGDSRANFLNQEFTLCSGRSDKSATNIGIWMSCIETRIDDGKPSQEFYRYASWARTMVNNERSYRTLWWLSNLKSETIALVSTS